MGRYNFNEVETGEGDEFIDSGSRGFDSRNANQPKQSHIRRKNKWHQEEGMKPKARRSFKKIQHRLKYDWQGE